MFMLYRLCSRWDIALGPDFTVANSGLSESFSDNIDDES